MKCPNGSESVLSAGPFAQLIAIKHCPCDDGVARRARITLVGSFADIPASVCVQRRRVSGFVTLTEAGYTFRVNESGKNAALLPHPK